MVEVALRVPAVSDEDLRPLLDRFSAHAVAAMGSALRQVAGPTVSVELRGARPITKDEARAVLDRELRSLGSSVYSRKFTVATRTGFLLEGAAILAMPRKTRTILDSLMLLDTDCEGPGAIALDAAEEAANILTASVFTPLAESLGGSIRPGPPQSERGERGDGAPLAGRSPSPAPGAISPAVEAPGAALPVVGEGGSLIEATPNGEGVGEIQDAGVPPAPDVPPPPELERIFPEGPVVLLETRIHSRVLGSGFLRIYVGAEYLELLAALSDAAAHAGTRARVLVVDDSEFARTRIAAVLRRDGIDEIAFAAGAAEALDVLDAAKPDIVILDLALEDDWGVNLLWRIKDRAKGVKLLVVSAVGQAEMVNTCLRLGADGYLVKPFLAERLVSEVRRIVTR